MILAIETSCDETAVAIISDQKKVLAECLSSQVKVHTQYGGVVPELASRMHCEVIHSLIEKSLADANLKLEQIKVIAVTYGPGLEGALLVGMTVAKTLACILNIPLIPINHMQGHLYAYFIENEPEFPYLALIVSGGHTQLVHVNDHFQFDLLGQTRDDAVGEAFDKVARQLGLGYPGGPEIEIKAKNGDKNAFKFPRAMKNKGYEFSFSGLKTAVIEVIRNNDITQPNILNNICASFQQAVCDILWIKSLRACKSFNLNKILITGGVAANQTLQSYFVEKTKKENITLWSIPKQYCTDNAVMIGITSFFKQKYDKQMQIEQKIESIRVIPGAFTCN